MSDAIKTGGGHVSDRNRAACAHQNFDATVLVVRLLDSGTFTTEIAVRCVDCGVRFEWIGPEMGLSPSEPMVSADRFELRAPIRPNAHMTSLMAEARETSTGDSTEVSSSDS